jgi:3-oxoadipate enol-lactonase
MDGHPIDPGPGPATFVDAGGVALHVRRDPPTGTPAAGSGAPTLVYLHSLGTELRIWDGVVERLRRHDQLRLDLRGHGLSEVPAGEYTIAAMTHDLFQALDRLGVGAIVAIGVSVGGQVALRAALERPAQVVGVVALDTAGRIRDAASWSERMAEVRAGGLEPLADATVARWFVPDHAARAPLLVAGYRRLLLRTSLDGYVATCAALRDEDLGPRLGEIAQPVLVLCGSHDEATPPDVVRGLARALPRGRYVEIADAAHLPCIDRPDATAALIDAFVRDLAGG